MPRTAVQPDTGTASCWTPPAPPHLRLDVYPDGGLSRLRLFGDLDEQALADARRTWWDALPPGHQR